MLHTPGRPQDLASRTAQQVVLGVVPKTAQRHGATDRFGRANKAVVVSDDHPALLRARRRRLRWSEEDRRLYQRHRWRSEGFHGEAKTWHGLARAVRRGLQNMRIQALLTAAAINLKRLAAALLALFVLGRALLSGGGSAHTPPLAMFF